MIWCKDYYVSLYIFSLLICEYQETPIRLLGPLQMILSS